MRTISYWVSVVFLLFLGLSGVQNFFRDWGLVGTLGQMLSGLGQLTFGASGLLAGVGAVLKQWWARPAALVFAVSGGITAALSSIAWGGADMVTGIASGVLGFLIGILLYWGIGRRSTPTQPE